MTTLNQYFSKIFCLNLAKRTDRWAHVEEQCRVHNLTVERFEGYDIKADGGGNYGCSASHRAMMEIIAYHRWPRVLILEDDFEFIVPNANESFSSMIGEVPEDWEWLWLGGHYACNPKYRHSQHVMRIENMLTTSSYAVTWKTAREVAPWIQGGSGIDSIFFGFTAKMRAYCLCPRICVQYCSHSNIQEKTLDYRGCMTDTSHESRFPWPPKQ